MAAGMTSKGFVPKRLAEIQGDINDGLAEIIDPKSNERPFQNITDDSILQQIVGVFAEALSEAWNAAYEGAIQFDPLKNSGAGQSGTVQLNAILRKPAEGTIVKLLCEGSPGTIIPEGSLVSSEDGIHIYSTLRSVSISLDGEVLVNAQAINQDTFVPAIGVVSEIITAPASGNWTSASNIELVSAGVAAETDEELRVRQQQSTTLTSYRLIEAIRGAVYNVPGVIYCRAYQNAETFPQDDRGIPFKEVAVVAEGGDSRAIAEAIFLRLPTGQIGYGNTHESFLDTQGIYYTIGFSRPTEVEIYVNVTVRITDRSIFPDNASSQIAENIVEYAQYGGAGQEDGFPPGTEIVMTRLYTPINDVPGHSIVSVFVGSDPENLLPTDVNIAWDEVARFATGRITVTIEG